MTDTKMGQLLLHPAFTKAKSSNGSGSPAQIEKPTAKPRKKSKSKSRAKLARFDADLHFWPYVLTADGPDACHPWVGHIDHGNGYGRLWGIEGIPYAHRKAWEVANGRKVPRGKMIAHACHTKLCCNPDHLAPKTRKQNVADSVKAGLLKGGPLTPDEVRRVVSLRFVHLLNYTQIAKKIGCANATVSHICKGRTHQKITGIVCSGTPRSKKLAALSRQAVRASASAGAVA